MSVVGRRLPIWMWVGNGSFQYVQDIERLKLYFRKGSVAVLHQTLILAATKGPFPPKETYRVMGRISCSY